MRRISSVFRIRPRITRLTLALLAASCTLAGCTQPTTDVPPGSRLSADAPPALAGHVVDEAGRPVAHVDLRVYTGFASYRPLTTCRTDSKGRFRVPITGGAMLQDAEGRWASYMIGVRIEHGDVPDPAGGLHWTGRVSTTPGSVRRVTFRVERGTVTASDA